MEKIRTSTLEVREFGEPIPKLLERKCSSPEKVAYEVFFILTQEKKGAKDMTQMLDNEAVNFDEKQ